MRRFFPNSIRQAQSAEDGASGIRLRANHCTEPIHFCHKCAASSLSEANHRLPQNHVWHRAQALYSPSFAMTHQETLNRTELRDRIRAAVPTDSDLEAFCGDFFPEAASRFTNGMDRIAKTNLLLDLADAPAIIKALSMHAPRRLEEYERLRSPSFTEGGHASNPYRGLAAFQVDDARLFFGRQALTKKLWLRFKELYDAAGAVRLLVILGPSGAGKSSVARAGLLAMLSEHPVPGPQAPRVVTLKPGERPIENLARALVPLLPLDSAVLPASRAVAIEDLLRNPAVPAEGLRRFAAELPGITEMPLVLLLDQFEEIYTLCTDRAERDALVGLLLSAARDRSRHVVIVLTLRSDFLGQNQRHHPELNRILVDQCVLVGGMSPDELRQAIAEPALRAGCPIDQAAVELLLGESRDSDGALPLLEFALTRIWEALLAGMELSTTLRQIGGVGGALAVKAQEIYDALSPLEQATARRALVRLVRLGEGTRDTRRRLTIHELCGRGQTEEDVLEVLRHFATAGTRLVTLSGDGIDTIAELTHEALFEHWAALRKWIDENRVDRRFEDRVAEAARLWAAAQRPPGRLWRAPDLDQLRDYWRRKRDWLNPLQETFLQAAERHHRREKLRSWGAIAAVVGAIIAAAVIFIIGNRQRRQEADAANQRILQQQLDTYVEKGRALLIEKDNPTEALLWLHRAQAKGSTHPSLRVLLRQTVRKLGLDPVQMALIGHEGEVQSAEYSPNGRRIVTVSEDHTVRVWEANTGRVLTALQMKPYKVWNATFSSDSRHIVTTSGDGVARVWEAETGRLVANLQDHKNMARTAAFSPDGSRIVTASVDRTARLWEAETGRLISEFKALLAPKKPPPANLENPLEKIRRLEELEEEEKARESCSAAFSPDGRRILLNSVDSIRVWDTGPAHLRTELWRHGVQFRSATFSPNGRHIITTSWSKPPQIWDADTGALLFQLEGNGGESRIATYSPNGNGIVATGPDGTAAIWVVNGDFVTKIGYRGPRIGSAAYSPDGCCILTTHEDRIVRIWDADSGRPIVEFRGHQAEVNSAAYSPDGRYVVTASADKTARIWKVDLGRMNTELKDYKGLIGNERFSSDGRYLVATSEDYTNTVRVWESVSGRLLPLFNGHDARVHGAMLSPDGSRLVTTSNDNIAHVWETDSRRLLAVLKGHRETVWSAAFGPDGRRIVTASKDGTARVWEADSGRLIAEFKDHADGVHSASFSPNGCYIVTASTATRIWAVETGLLAAEFETDRGSVDSAAYSPNGRFIVTRTGNTARVWEVDTRRLVAELKHHESEVLDAAFSPDSYFVVTASADKTARLWEAGTGLMVGEFMGGPDSPHGSTRLFEAAPTTFANSDDPLTKLRRLEEAAWMARKHSLSATFSPDGRRILTADLSNTTTSWDIAPETRTADQLTRLIRCHVLARFEREDNDLIITAQPNPAECQSDQRTER